MFQQTPYAQAFLKKQAFVPYTQEAMNPPQDPSMQGQPPQDPNAPGSPAPQIQTQPGPNGEPIDVETGLVVVDPQQGIEQDPNTGILYNKFQDQFMTPDGQPLDPQQAIQMIQQAQQQGAAAQPPAQGQDMPPQGPEGMPPEQGMPPQGPEEMPPQGQEPPPEQGGMQMPPQQMQPGQSFDPSTGMMMDDATGMPIDPNTGMIVDPRTGQQINPQTGEVMPPQGGEGPFTGDPEVQKVIDKLIQQNEKNEKQIAALSRNVNSTRTDIQGLRREISESNDNNDVIQQRLENATALLEQLIGRLG